MTQQEKAERFQALHQRPRGFVIPNPWDAGSARVLAFAGFEALATTSSGFAYARGKQDYGITRDELLDHIRELAAITDLPISADLENGFGADPETCAETIRLAADAGAVGGSIEDASGDPAHPIYRIEHAAERVRAAAEAARALGFPFMLTARTEIYLHGRPDLDEAIRRLQAFEQAGADVLFAPGVTNRDEIDAMVRAINRPVNVLAGIPLGLTVNDLANIGVKRISIGGALCRVAVGALHRAARELHDYGTFDFLQDAIPSRQLNPMLL